MVVRVAIVGHSQLPVIADYEDIKITRYFRPGAKLDYIDDRECASLLRRSWDIVIIFLGGNDICQTNPNLVADRALAIVRRLNAHEVFLVNAETRVYYPARAAQFEITTEEYQIRANAYNQRLKRLARSTKVFRSVHLPPGYSANSGDGIHFNTRGKLALIAKFKRTIANAKARLPQ